MNVDMKKKNREKMLRKEHKSHNHQQCGTKIVKSII